MSKDKWKLMLAVLLTLGGWFVTLQSWSTIVQTPSPLGGLLILLVTNVGAAVGINLSLHGMGGSGGGSVPSEDTNAPTGHL